MQLLGNRTCRLMQLGNAAIQLLEPSHPNKNGLRYEEILNLNAIQMTHESKYQYEAASMNAIAAGIQANSAIRNLTEFPTPGYALLTSVTTSAP